MKRICRPEWPLLIALALMSFKSSASEIEDLYHNQPFTIPQNENYFSLTQMNFGSVDYDDHTLVTSDEETSYGIHHLRHSKIDDSQYIIWNFLPVGIGYSFPENGTDFTSAEWKLNYEASGAFPVSPNFTGKKRSLWSAAIGDEILVSYGYHYQENPNPSFWDLSLKYTLFLIPKEKWHIGAFVQPKKFMKGLYSAFAKYSVASSVGFYF